MKVPIELPWDPNDAAILARQFIIMTKDTLDPRISFSLIMESAIAMSKIDPKAVPQEDRPSNL